MTKKLLVRDIVALVEELYPPARAEAWDSVGLICGDENDQVTKILVGLDPVAELGEEARLVGADFILTHHPLFLRGTSSVATTTPKGALVHSLIRQGIALMNAHTNADCAENGVAQALAKRLGLENIQPMNPRDDDPHLGLGRIGILQTPISFAAFAEKVAAVLPTSAPGLLGSGDPDAPVQKVVVSPGAGDSFLQRARELEADVYITADLRHHPASEHVEGGKPYLLCGTHWATESIWIRDAVPAIEALIQQRYPFADVSVIASTIVTEPWNIHLPTKG